METPAKKIEYPEKRNIVLDENSREIGTKIIKFFLGIFPLNKIIKYLRTLQPPLYDFFNFLS